MSGQPSFFFTVPAGNPRTLCSGQSVVCIISSMLAPSGWLNSVSTCSCLVTRSTFGSSAFNGVFAVVAADVTLRRAVALDLTLLFLDAAAIRFRDFAMEGVDIFRLRWFAASELTLARPKAPQIAGRALSAPAGSQIHRPTHIAMRPLRQKSSRIRTPRKLIIQLRLIVLLSSHHTGRSSISKGTTLGVALEDHPDSRRRAFSLRIAGKVLTFPTRA